MDRCWHIESVIKNQIFILLATEQLCSNYVLLKLLTNYEIRTALIYTIHLCELFKDKKQIATTANCISNTLILPMRKVQSTFDRLDNF